MINRLFYISYLSSMQEEKKILYYYPERDLDIQIKNIGLSEAIIKFAQYV